MNGGENILIANDGNLIVSAHIDHHIDSIGSFYLIKLDLSGNRLWTKEIKANYPLIRLKSLIKTSDGGYLITGSSIRASGVLYWKTDSNGKLQWHKEIGSKYGVVAMSTVESINGDFITCGAYGISAAVHIKHLFLLRIDVAGNLLWFKEHEDSLKSNTLSYYNYARSMIENPDFSLSILGDRSRDYADSSQAQPPFIQAAVMNSNELTFQKFDDKGNKLVDSTLENSISQGVPELESANLLDAGNEFILTGNYDQVVFVRRLGK